MGHLLFSKKTAGVDLTSEGNPQLDHLTAKVRALSERLASLPEPTNHPVIDVAELKAELETTLQTVLDRMASELNTDLRERFASLGKAHAEQDSLLRYYDQKLVAQQEQISQLKKQISEAKALGTHTKVEIITEVESQWKTHWDSLALQVLFLKRVVYILGVVSMVALLVGVFT